MPFIALCFFGNLIGLSCDSVVIRFLQKRHRISLRMMWPTNKGLPNILQDLLSGPLCGGWVVVVWLSMCNWIPFLFTKQALRGPQAEDNSPLNIWDTFLASPFSRKDPSPYPQKLKKQLSQFAMVQFCHFLTCNMGTLQRACSGHCNLIDSGQSIFVIYKKASKHFNVLSKSRWPL